MLSKESKKRLACWMTRYLLSGVFSVTGALSAFGQPVDVINIASPNKDGISVNQSVSFSVTPKGVVLNNATVNTKTNLAGMVAANANLKGKAATVILQEVTGKEQSQLTGTLEIAGTPADFILANPNGIYADGARFVNANQVSLWAGTPVYQNGNLMREKVKLGANGIQVGRSGLRIGEKSKLQLAARTLSLEGDVKAGQIEVFASTGTLNLQRSSTLKKAEKPRERLVDIAETGGMYANSIYIQAMESGTAVQNKGTLQASQKLHITANGDIVLRGAMQAPEVKVRAANNVDVIRKQAAQEVELPLMESKDIKLAENGAAVWNIENANWLGISINRTDALYVGKKGLVLNNAVKPYRTQTAGLVQPNANLQGEPAELIVCEGSKDEGLIRGNIEIAGPRTDLLLASPAGLTIYGGKAINIGELTLVTGSCRFIQGVPLLRMNPSGMLVLGEKGLDGDNTDSITLSTKYLYHGAGIKTPSLNMVMGGSSLPMKFMETKKPAGMSALYMEYFTPGSARSYTVGKGIPELDVAAPDEQGISVNELGEFQVKKNGYIFNNALQETETQLAGKIEKNMNLWLNPARLIVGQAAKSTSHIQGDIEIAGERASLLLANPKGFVLDGGKVINANRVTFLAGTATRTGQEFSLLPQTSVEVKKGGLVTIDSVQTNFIGNKVKIGGTLTASNLNVIAGSGKTNYSDLRTSQATDKKEEFLEITGDGKIKAENLSLVAAGTNTGLIQNGKIETNRRFTATMTGNILLNGYTGVGIGEIRTGKNIANNGYLNGEILYLKGNHIINKGSVFGADVNLAFADLENSGTVIKDPLPPAEDFDTKIKAADAQLKKAKNTLQEFVEENGPILYNPDLTEIFVELKEEVVKAEKELEKAEKAKADYLQKKGSTTDQQETGSVIYGSRNVALAGNRVYNRPNAVIYSDGLLRIHGKTDKEKADLVHNNGASLYGKDRIAIAAKQLQNTNASLKLKTIDGKWENDPDRIEIDAPGSDYNHVIATKKYFEDLNGRHSYRYVPHPDERGKYETISREQLKEYLEENPFTEDMEFDEFNAWENDHEETTEFLKGLGINTDAAETWSESQIIEKVEEALLKKYGKNLDDYNKMAEEYNKVLTFHNYWEIHSKHKNINTNLLQSLPGQIISDGNMKLEGTVTNKDSLFNAADRLEITGILKNTATAVEKRVVHDGTVQHAAPEQHWHHFHNKTERRWTAAEPYKEPDDVMKYYLPTVSYTVDSKNPANLSALTEGERKALEHGRYRVDEVIRGQRKFLGFIIDKDQGLQEKMASSLLSARELVLTGEAGSVNEGTLLGNTVTVGGKEFTNKGIIEAKDVTMKAEGMFRNSGDITAEKKLIAEAKNVQITREPVAARERDWKKDEPGGMVVTGKDALLYLGAKEELLLKNQRLAATGKGGRIVADAQRDITLEVDTQTKTIGTTQSENNIRTLTTDSGSMMDAMGDISLQAGRNINIKASSVWSGEGKVTLLAGNDINVTTGKNLMDSHYYWRHKNGGMGSKRGTFTEDQKAYEKDPISTEIFGKSVKLAAKRDVNLLSSNSITRDNTLIKAGRDITSAVDTSLKKTEYTRTFTGSGIRSGGFFGIQIGRWSETHTSASESTQPVPTTITSTHGKVDLDAEGRIHATTTYIYGKDGVTLSGADILLDGSQAKHKYSQTDAYRFKGLSAGLGGRAI